MRRVVSFGFALAVVFAGMLGAVRAQEATPAAGVDTTGLARTNVRYFLPFDGDGLSEGLTVTGNESGVCAHESLASPGRPDAWNCIGETSNAIFDPCFESPFSTPDEPGDLACVDSPYTTDVVLFAPTQALPRFKDMESGPPPPAPDAPMMPLPGSDKPLPGSPALPQPSSQMDGGSLAMMEMRDPLPWALELADGEQCTLATGATAVFAGMRINYFCPGGSVLGEPDRGLPVWAVTYLPEGAFVAELVEVAAVWH